MSIVERIMRMHSREKELQERIDELLKENTELRDQVETLTVQVEGWQKQVMELKDIVADQYHVIVDLKNEVGL